VPRGLSTNGWASLGLIAQLPTSARARVLAVVLLLVLIILGLLLAITAVRWVRGRLRSVTTPGPGKAGRAPGPSAWEEAGRRARAESTEAGEGDADDGSGREV